MEILFKDENIVAVYKPYGMPSQSDLSGDNDAMSLTSGVLAEIKEPSNLYLVHRLDRVVGGVLVFARNKKYAAVLSQAFQERSVDKDYIAVVHGEAPGGELCDYLYKDSASGKAYVTDGKRRGVKEAKLVYQPLACKSVDGKVRTLVKIHLLTGRFHQIRVQFSSRKMSLLGDGKYGSKDNKPAFPALFAFHVGFEVKGKRYDFYKYPDKNEYPWSDFEEYI